MLQYSRGQKTVGASLIFLPVQTATFLKARATLLNQVDCNENVGVWLFPRGVVLQMSLWVCHKFSLGFMKGWPPVNYVYLALVMSPTIFECYIAV